MSEEDDLRAELERMRAKIEAIDANKDRIRLQVSVKGALSPVRDPPLPGHVLRGRVGDDPRKER